MSVSPVSARLFVLLAREARLGVVLRRGPSDWVQMIQWDTKKDIFTPGQWFHGRIYEHRCDISPNGRLFVYCAYKPGNKVYNPDYGDRWTAISKPPYFTALALWPLESSNGGGGYFVDRKRVILNHFETNQTPHPEHRPEIIEVEAADRTTFMQNSVFFYRMQRDNWQSGYRKSSIRLHFWYKGKNLPQKRDVVTFEKKGLICEVSSEYRLAVKHKSLHEIVPNYRYRYRYFDSNAHEYVELSLKDVSWADRDQKNRLVIAKEGKIFSGVLQDGELLLTELADFNANQPERVETPKWAKNWG